MLTVSLVLIVVVCTALSIRTKQLLVAALWLAVVSAAVAALLYSLGAHEIAVIELSVGTGLVPVLFVFAASLMGKESTFLPSIVPPPLAYGLVLICFALLLWMIFSGIPTSTLQSVEQPTFRMILWDARGLDMLVQGVLIFAGVLSILNLLSAVRSSTSQTMPQPNTRKPQEVNSEVL